MRACGEDSSHLTLPSLPGAVAWARRHAESSLRAWQLDADTVETTRLVVSELVTNAVRCGRETPPATAPDAADPAARVTLVLWLLDGQVGIEVCDSHPGWPVAAAAGPHAETGRGRPGPSSGM